MKRIRISAEIVKKPEDLATGLMGRKCLGRNSGMLFDFRTERPLSFWMARTYIPLQIAFIDDSGRIGQIERMAPLSTRAVRSYGSYRYALEVNDGWFDDNRIFVGAQAALPGMDAHPVNPDVAIDQSIKDILKAADTYGVTLMVDYVSKSGFDVPLKTIVPPFEFAETADGDPEGIVIVRDAQRGRYSSLIIENITAVKDMNGNPVVNAQQVQAISKEGISTPPAE